VARRNRVRVCGAVAAAGLALSCGEPAPTRLAPAGLDAALDAAFVGGDRTIAGGWHLTGSDGAAMDASDLLGRWSVVGVGYTSCPDVCPAALSAMPRLLDQVRARLPDPTLLQVVFIAVDPSRDTDGLEDYRAHFEARMPAPLRAATGTPEMLAATAEDLGLAFDVKGTDVQHSTAWALVSPTGRIEGYLLHPTDPDRCIAGADAVLANPEGRWMNGSDVRVEDGWLREPPPGAHIAAAYGRIRNDAPVALRLISASRVDGSSVAVHETVVKNGIAGMRPATVDLPPRGEARLQPMGAHLMIDHAADQPFVDVRLAFDDGQALWTRFSVEAAP